MKANRTLRDRLRALPGIGAFVLVTVVAVLAARPAAAAKFAGAFMEDGGGARALGMGGAFAAVADDASATFWNPAGLARGQSRQILLMHSERFGDLVDRDFAAFVTPVSWSLLGGQDGGFGLTVIRLGVDDIPFTEHLADQLDINGDGVVDENEVAGIIDLQDQIRYKSDQEFALLVSYGERKGAWLVGANLKFIRQSVGDYGSFGIGADVGVLRPGIWNRLDFGLKLQDITTTYLSWDTGTNEVIYPAVVPGLAYNIAAPSLGMDIVLAGDLTCRFEDRGDADQITAGDFSANAHVGVEVGFSRKVFLRGGYDSGFDTNHLTAGAGFLLGPLTVDYAYQGDVVEIDEPTHRISLAVRF